MPTTTMESQRKNSLVVSSPGKLKASPSLSLYEPDAEAGSSDIHLAISRRWGPLTIERDRGLKFSLQAYTQDHSQPGPAFSGLQTPSACFLTVYLLLSLDKVSISTVTQNGCNKLTFQITPIRKDEGNILVSPDVSQVCLYQNTLLYSPSLWPHRWGSQFILGYIQPIFGKLFFAKN